MTPRDPRARRRARILAVLTLVAASSGPGSPVAGQGVQAPSAGPRLVIRSDDLGFSHGANVANRRLLESGLVANVSVLFCAPWYGEAVEILRQFPEAAVGVHLCANSEWKNYRWGPVADRSRVPSLVDAEGHFWGSYRELNIDRTPDVAELELEFRAQIERALRSGIRITYLDNHMGAGLRTPEQRAMVQRLAHEYGLVLSGSFGEVYAGDLGSGSYREQLARLVSRLGELKPDSLYLMVFHLGTDTPELRAMQDLNEGGVPNMSEQRQLELDLLLSPEFRDALAAHRIRLVSYRELAALHAPSAAQAQEGPWTSLFDGRTLNGWEGDPTFFTVEDGAIVGGRSGAPTPQNEFLCTLEEFDDFVLRVRFRLEAGVNSGVQIRTRRIPGSHEVIGYQADLGDGYWGALYDESRRNRVLAGPDAALIPRILRRHDWNQYEIFARGPRVRLLVNGHATVDFREPDASVEQAGRICLQIHSGPPGRVWFRDLQIRRLASEPAEGGA